ncbi:MAG TPA: transcriptional regulator [Cyanobacteria bacterium UBA11369]|nr:transcriptional regulator [Cyanobacteria bacterium UBA11371]HBE50961.1 transcriptional regulator [Cyanobacteria bacterium UBA11369]
MNAVKRIEIIANYIELERILKGLDQAGVPGYTVIRDVAGKSTRGDGKHDLAMTMLDNVYIVAFFPPEKLDAVVANIRAILNKFGGSCFISDAMEMRTTKCVG